jgi:hypothetical protein
VVTVTWPDARLNAIESREDLARYLQELANAIDNGSVDTANSATSDFIDAAGRWSGSMDGFFQNVMGSQVPDTPSWAMIAAIFRAAIVYE